MWNLLWMFLGLETIILAIIFGLMLFSDFGETD